jgi:hypothetical protein
VPVDVVGVHYLPASNPFRSPSEIRGPGAIADANVDAHSTDAQAHLATTALAARMVGADRRHLGAGAIACVKHVDGVKSLSLQSTVSLRNDSGVPLLVQFDVPSTAPGASMATHTATSTGRPIVPGDRFNRRGSCLVKPDGSLSYRRLVMPGDLIYAPLHAAATG